MTNKVQYFEWKGYVIALVAFIVSLLLFYNDTFDFFYSLVGALFSAGMIWAGYFIIRIIILATKS